MRRMHRAQQLDLAAQHVLDVFVSRFLARKQAPRFLERGREPGSKPLVLIIVFATIGLPGPFARPSRENVPAEMRPALRHFNYT
jgi:hypothetical protein